jgi:two-component system, sensor histidine kinase and response regulator
MSDNPIDTSVLDALRQLQSDARPDFPAKIIGLFLDTAPSALKELETAASASDPVSLRTASHRLLSASAAVGALRLSSLCQELDRIVKRGSVPSDAAERVQAIGEEYRRAAAALEVWRAARGSIIPPKPA